ncbi:Crp/Fnr family transcriptional regulator [Oricola indica]|uniref:Crp/Fnr family transcriptional regulator n=1 Tax=Oricola indica TaxID=2872591 RepID=UPI003CCBFF79
MQFAQFLDDFTAYENIFGHLTYVLAIVSMIMRTMSWLRFFAILSGLVALIYFGLVRGDYVSAFWEACYVTVNVAQLFLLWYENRPGQFDGAERDFVTRALMDLKPVHAAKMVHQARHETVPGGQVIVTEGTVPDKLYFVVSGKVQIVQHGVVIGTCGKGDFLGEMSLLSRGEANATASTLEPCEMLVFERAALERLVARVEPVRHALHAGISRNLLEKIARMNAFSVSANAPETA